MNELLTLTEVSHRLGIKRGAVECYYKRCKIWTTKINGVLYTTEQSVRDWREKRASDLVKQYSENLKKA